MEWVQEFSIGRIGLLKSVAAILLVLSLFFPMHSCTTYEANSQSSATAKSEALAHTQYYYAWTADYAGDLYSYATLFAYIWPALAICLARFQPLQWQWRIGLRLFETLCLACTAWRIYVDGWAIGHPEAGAYIATLGFGLYLIAWSVDTLGRFHNGIRSWKTAPT